MDFDVNLKRNDEVEWDKKETIYHENPYFIGTIYVIV